MQISNKSIFIAILILIQTFAGHVERAEASPNDTAITNVSSHAPSQENSAIPMSANYRKVQERLARGWNTWDTNSVATHVLLPEGLAIHTSLKHNNTESDEDFLGDILIGRLQPDAEQVTPGPHAWDGRYTELKISWKGHSWRIQSAHDGSDLVLVVTPLPSSSKSALPPSIVFSVDFLWNRRGTVQKLADSIQTHGASGAINVYCTCATPKNNPKDFGVSLPVSGPYFAADLNQPVGVSTGKRRTLPEIVAIVVREQDAYKRSLDAEGSNGPIADAIQTTLGWDTIYEPSKQRVVSPVSRVWSVRWGGYVLFDWDTFFAATLAAIGDRDLALADAVETLRESTQQGFVPNYARAGGWKSSDRSEPPVGAITVLGLYKKFQTRWFIEDTFEPLLRWNRWWAQHRDIQGYLAWGSDGSNKPENLDDNTRGTRAGAILESGLDNSPMYDATTYNPELHVLEYADVGLMSMYIADCDALAQISRILKKPAEAKELQMRSARYRAKLATLWDEKTGIFLNKDLHTGEFNTRLSPTNFYPMLAHVASEEQAKMMVEKHLLNTTEFWGDWIIPSIEKNDNAFHDQDYWRGRIWGPMNYLVYLGLRNYADTTTRKEFARKSYELFLKEWRENGHVHENYNAISGSGDDVPNSDRFYHWGALLGYVEYLDQSRME